METDEVTELKRRLTIAIDNLAIISFSSKKDTWIHDIAFSALQNVSSKFIKTNKSVEDKIVKKAIESLTSERLRTYLGYLFYSFGEHVNIDELFYHKHINEDVPFPDELIKEYKENLIEILTHDDN